MRPPPRSALMVSALSPTAPATTARRGSSWPTWPGPPPPGSCCGHREALELPESELEALDTERPLD
ncbi:MAG: hypothetical protein OXG67_17760 [bacterium]|nr:hypothetical protein [bacterium]